MRAFMVCRNFSINDGMLARNGVVQGLPAKERKNSGSSDSRHHHRRKSDRDHREHRDHRDRDYRDRDRDRERGGERRSHHYPHLSSGSSNSSD